MKIESIIVKNFKRFQEPLEVSFKHRTLQDISNRFLILGDNGTGKTTLLQAIALPLAFATRAMQSIEQFNWLGFLSARYWPPGTLRPWIELEVSFEPEEIQATREIAQLWYDSQSQTYKEDPNHPKVTPTEELQVKVILDGDFCKIGKNSREERAQFQGRYYAQWLLKRKIEQITVRTKLPDLPGIFWFDQFRNLGLSLSTEKNEEAKTDTTNTASFELGIGSLRQYLIEWRQHAERGRKPQPINFLSELERLYKMFFPKRSFWGLEHLPSQTFPTEEEIYFLLSDELNQRYDLVEMSGGEQAIFPILYQIVRQQIGHSIILIDEIDLNLHPPLAQAFIRQLPKIGKQTEQFIFTTHSEAVSSIIGEAETYRLPGGSLCL